MSLVFFDHFSTTLAEPLAASSTAMVLAEAGDLPLHLQGDDDYTYLLISDGLRHEEVLVESVNGQVATLVRTEDPLDFPCGARVEFKLTSSILRDVVCSVDCQITMNPDTGSDDHVAIKDGKGIKLKDNAYHLDLCGLDLAENIANDAAVAVCSGQLTYRTSLENLVSKLAELNQLDSCVDKLGGIESISYGTGIENLGTKTRPKLALESIHEGFIAQGFEIDKRGRVIGYNPATVNAKAGVYQPAKIVIVDGQVVEYGQADAETYVKGIEGGNCITIKQKGSIIPGGEPLSKNEFIISLAPGPLAEKEVQGIAFDECGFVMSVNGDRGDGEATTDEEDINQSGYAANYYGYWRGLIPGSGGPPVVGRSRNLDIQRDGTNLIGTFPNGTPVSNNYSVLVWSDGVRATVPFTTETQGGDSGDDIITKGSAVIGTHATVSGITQDQFTVPIRSRIVGLNADKLDVYRWLFEDQIVNIVVFT